MSPKNSNSINFEKLIALFFTFVLATAALLVLSYTPIVTVGWFGKLRTTLFYFGFFGYGFVILTFMAHYIEKVSKWLREDKMRLIITITSLLGFSYALFSGLHEKSWLIFFRDVAGAGLVIVGLPFIEKGVDKVTKWRKKKADLKKPK